MRSSRQTKSSQEDSSPSLPERAYLLHIILQALREVIVIDPADISLIDAHARKAMVATTTSM